MSDRGDGCEVGMAFDVEVVAFAAKLLPFAKRRRHARFF